MKIEREELLELIRRSREKDLDAQEELVRAVQDRVYYHCKKMLKIRRMPRTPPRPC